MAVDQLPVKVDRRANEGAKVSNNSLYEWYFWGFDPFEVYPLEHLADGKMQDDYYR